MTAGPQLLDSAIRFTLPDPDHRFALYMSVGKTGKETPPHDHTTWACIGGIKGKEHNKLYDRVDDGKTPFRGEVRERALVSLDGFLGDGL